MLVLKASILCIIAVALCIAANVARAESYGSDAPKAGVAAASEKQGKVKVRSVRQLVVHPNSVSPSRKPGK